MGNTYQQSHPKKGGAFAGRPQTRDGRPSNAPKASRANRNWADDTGFSFLNEDDERHGRRRNKAKPSDKSGGILGTIGENLARSIDGEFPQGIGQDVMGTTKRRKKQSIYGNWSRSERYNEGGRSRRAKIRHNPLDVARERQQMNGHPGYQKMERSELEGPHGSPPVPAEARNRIRKEVMSQVSSRKPPANNKNSRSPVDDNDHIRLSPKDYVVTDLSREDDRGFRKRERQDVDYMNVVRNSDRNSALQENSYDEVGDENCANTDDSRLENNYKHVEGKISREHHAMERSAAQPVSDSCNQSEEPHDDSSFTSPQPKVNRRRVYESTSDEEPSPFSSSDVTDHGKKRPSGRRNTTTHTHTFLPSIYRKSSQSAPGRDYIGKSDSDDEKPKGQRNSDRFADKFRSNNFRNSGKHKISRLLDPVQPQLTIVPGNAADAANNSMDLMSIPIPRKEDAKSNVRPKLAPSCNHNGMQVVSSGRPTQRSISFKDNGNRTKSHPLEEPKQGRGVVRAEHTTTRKLGRVTNAKILSPKLTLTKHNQPTRKRRAKAATPVVPGASISAARTTRSTSSMETDVAGSRPANRGLGKRKRRQSNEVIEISDDEVTLAHDSREEEWVSFDVPRITFGKRLCESGCKVLYKKDRLRLVFDFVQRSKTAKGQCIEIDFSTDACRLFKHFTVSNENDDKANGAEELVNFFVLNVQPSEELGWSYLKNLRNAYKPGSYRPLSEVAEDKRDDARKSFVAVQCNTGEEIQTMMANLHTPMVEGSLLSEDEAYRYSHYLMEAVKKGKSRRVHAKVTDEFIKGRPEDSVLLVYPFDGNPETLDQAATGLKEASDKYMCGEASENGINESISAPEEIANEASAALVQAAPPKCEKRRHFLTIQVRDFERLCPGEFLNDTLVDFWFQWITRKVASHDLEVHCFSSHFFTTLADEGVKSVEKWTARKGINVFNKKFIFIPINEALHWSLCVVINPGYIASNDENGPMPCMLFLDSLRAHRKKKVSNQVRMWLNSEWRRISNEKSDPFKDKSAFPLLDPIIPYQDNSWDCGVFVCRYAYAVYCLRKEEFLKSNQWFAKDLTNCKEFQFDMDDICRLREELRKLVENLSEIYIPWKEERKQESRKAKLERKAKKESLLAKKDVEQFINESSPVKVCAEVAKSDNDDSPHGAAACDKLGAENECTAETAAADREDGTIRDEGSLIGDGKNDLVATTDGVDESCDRSAADVGDDRDQRSVAETNSHPDKAEAASDCSMGSEREVSSVDAVLYWQKGEADRMKKIRDEVLAGKQDIVLKDERSADQTLQNRVSSVACDSQPDNATESKNLVVGEPLMGAKVSSSEGESVNQGNEVREVIDLNDANELSGEQSVLQTEDTPIATFEASRMRSQQELDPSESQHEADAGDSCTANSRVLAGGTNCDDPSGRKSGVARRGVRSSPRHHQTWGGPGRLSRNEGEIQVDAI